MKGLSPRAHNFVSYAGAVLAYAIFARRVDDLPSVLWNAHFVRRALESLILFRFSAPYVSIADSVTEFAYYWIFAALIAQYAANKGPVGEAFTFLGVLLWVFGESCNFCCHRTLASAPRRSEKVRMRISSSGSFLFGRITCPHYFFEMVSWLGFNLATGCSLPGMIFMTAGAIIMTSYAVQKHEKAPKSSKHTPVFPYLDIRPPKFVSGALAR